MGFAVVQNWSGRDANSIQTKFRFRFKMLLTWIPANTPAKFTPLLRDYQVTPMKCINIMSIMSLFIGRCWGNASRVCNMIPRFQPGLFLVSQSVVWWIHLFPGDGSVLMPFSWESLFLGWSFLNSLEVAWDLVFVARGWLLPRSSAQLVEIAFTQGWVGPSLNLIKPH